MRDCGESNLQNMSKVNSMDSESELAQSQDTPVGEVEPVVSAGSSEEGTEKEVTRQDSVGVERNDSINAGETNMDMFRVMMENMQAHLQNVLQTSTNNLELRLRENMQANNATNLDDLKENLKENNNNLEARIKENNNNLEARLKENQQANNDRLRENLQENSERIGVHVNNLKGEICQMGGDLRNVKESVAKIRTHVEAQLEIIQAEWNERLDNRFRGVQSELNGQVERLSGSFASQISVVNQQIDNIQEKINSSCNINQTADKQTQNRFRELEKEIEKLQNQVERTVEPLETRRERSVTSDTSSAEPGPSGPQRLEVRPASATQSSDRAPESREIGETSSVHNVNSNHCCNVRDSSGINCNHVSIPVSNTCDSVGVHGTSFPRTSVLMFILKEVWI